MAAISQEQRTDLLTLIVGIFDGAPSSAQLSELSAMLVNGSSMEDVANVLVNSEQFTETYPAFQTAQDFAEVLADNILGETVSAQTKTDAVNLVAGFVNDGQSFGEAAYNAISLLQDVDLAVNPEWTEAQAILANKAAVAEYFALNTDFSSELTTAQSQAVVDGVSSDTATVQEKTAAIDAGTIFGGDSSNTDLELIHGKDNKVGTSGNDTFLGDVTSNGDGAIANTLNTGDRLDGLGGRDTLDVTLINDRVEQGQSNGVDDINNEYAVRPITSNIEVVEIEATDDVTLNATRMSNVEEYWSDFSDADLTIQNVSLRGNNLQITKDLTFGLRDTNANTDFTAYIESPALTAAPDTVSNSQLSVQIADVSTETPATPLLNVNMNLGFTIGGESYVLEDLKADGGTYAGLITAVQTALAELGLGDLVVAAGNTYDQVTFAGNTVTLPFTATELLVSDPSGGVFSEVTFQQNAIEPVDDGFLVAGTAAPVAPTASSNLIETNVVLDYAGRGSIGGDVTIGGQSTSEEGVQQFNVTVDRDSSISSLVQTASSFIPGGDNNEQLMNIVIDSAEAKGDLYIGAIDANLELVNATAFEGAELSIGEGTAVSDLDAFNAAGIAGNVTFVADYSGDGRASSEQAFTIATGLGNDKITADVNGVSTSGSTNTNLTVNAGSGDNTVTLDSSDNTEVNAASVFTLGGKDTITGGSTNLTVSSGAGDDAIYAENTGTKAQTELSAGSAFSTVIPTAQMGSGTAQPANVNSANLLFGRQVTVTVAMPESAADTANPFTNGYEVTANITASNGYLTTERDLYEAAAKAINEDEVLNKLVSATVDSNGDLEVDYLVDGAQAVGSDLVRLDVVGQWSDLNSSNQANILADLKKEFEDSSITATQVENAYNTYIQGVTDSAAVDVAGTDAVTTGVNNVNAGTGNDVIALSSNDATIDTVVFDQGGFGNDTIVHFNDAANGDILDFSAWLDNEVVNDNASTSNESKVAFAANLVDLTGGLTTGSITANSVVVTDLQEIEDGTAGNVTFAGLTNTQVLEALNTDAQNVAVTANALVGNVYKSILLVENTDVGTDTPDLNTQNLGEYKVYEVTYDTTADTGNGAYTAANLVGSVDFGDSLDLGSMDDTNVA